MDNGDVRIQNLEGPFNYHLYIGFAPTNKSVVFNLRAKLEKHGVICYLRSLNDSIKNSIEEGVNTSQKCLLFLTSDYLKDDWYQIETQTVLKKSESFCRNVVVILKSEDLEVIPENLREFAAQQFKQEKLNDKKFLAQFVELVTQEPSVQLTVLPKQNIGYASACNYFYGFLRLVLPDFKKRLIESTLKNEPDLVPKTVQKMLIIMPESCFCAVELQSPGEIEFTEKFVVRVAHRAGNQKRDYKSSLYKLIGPEKQEEYYFVGELATPLLTMYETYFYGLCNMTKDQLYAERDGFYFTLKAILSHPDNAECNNQFKLLYWSDPATEKPNQLNIYDFLLPELRKEIKLQQEKPSKFEASHNAHLSPNPKPLISFKPLAVDGSNPAKENPSKLGANHIAHLSPIPHSLISFMPVAVDNYNPASIYVDSEIKMYPMDRRPRGLCLIVNIANFEKGHRHLLPRRGAEKDAEVLTKLFKDLHFEVQVHNDVNAHTLELLFLTTHITDHTNYDAFVCCILTHGKLGVIYTSDGKPIEILRLVDYFTDRNCPSLKGKPKMFFIQACQKGDPEQENVPAGNSLPHNGSTGNHLAPPSPPHTASDSAANVANGEMVEEEIREGTSSIQEEICNIAVTEVGPAIEGDATSVPTVSVFEESSRTTFRHKAVLVPGSPDFLMSYSTLPGSISYRDTQTGSLYIQSLCDCLRKGKEIDRALKLVSSNVRENLRQRGHDGVQELFQLPFHLTSGMDRLIYL